MVLDTTLCPDKWGNPRKSHSERERGRKRGGEGGRERERGRKRGGEGGRERERGRARGGMEMGRERERWRESFRRVERAQSGDKGGKESRVKEGEKERTRTETESVFLTSRPYTKQPDSQLVSELLFPEPLWFLQCSKTVCGFSYNT